MPRRKSRAYRFSKRSTSASISPRLPYRLTMLIPNRPVEGKEDEFIHTRPIDEEEAVSIAEKYGGRVYLVSEHIESDEPFLGEPVVRLPELLIAMEVIPVGSMVISFDENSRVENTLPAIEAAGAHLLNDKIYKDEEATKQAYDGSGIAYVMNIVNEKQPQLDWTGEIPKHVEDWVNLRFYAMLILNCCYVGRGAPTGVNLKEQADMMASNPALLARFVDSISSSMRELPVMENVRLPAWQEKILWEGRISHHYQKALKQSESFREFFHYRPMIFQSPEVALAEEEFRNIQQLMRDMLYAYENGEESDIPDVIWTAIGPEQMAEALDEIGAISTIEAYLMGVPIEDIMA